MNSQTMEDIRARFKLVCKKCGSDDVVVHVEEGIDYGELTGYSPGTVSIGCNACKQNDAVLYD